MGAENSYLKDNFKVLYRKSFMDFAIYIFIEAHRHLIPSVSIRESAKAFMDCNDITGDNYSPESVIQSYLRTRKQLIDEQRETGEKSAFLGRKGL